MFKKIAMVGLLIIFTVVLFAFTSLNPVLAENDKVSLCLSFMKNAQFAGPFVAEYKGFYEEFGIDITIRPGGIQSNPIVMVAAGKDTFGSDAPVSIIFAREQQMPLVAVATIFQVHPAGIMFLKKSGIKEPKDFIGKRLMYMEGGLWTIIKAMFAHEGIPLDSITTIAAPPSMVPLYTGQADGRNCFTTNDPILAKLEGIEVDFLLAYDYGIKTTSDSLFTSEKIIKENPDLVRRFVEATLKGWAYALVNKEEALDIVMKVNPELDREHQRLYIEGMVPYILTPESIMHGIGWMSRDTWVQTQEMLLEFGGLPKPINIDEVFTLDFLPRK